MKRQITEQKLNAVTVDALAHLVYRCDMSYADIGRAVGYPDGQMIGKVMRGDNFLPPWALVNVSRLASSEGFDALADLFSAPRKHAVCFGAAEVDGCTIEEKLAIQEASGQSSASERAGDLNAAEQHARRIIGSATTYLRELLLKQAEERGDGLPAFAHVIPGGAP